ncbi:MAG: hypothetical protein EOO28_29285 [Comamonadaceae bacterium]|nr:MAG: hypothetical protein EOO28_29285 [Comamonadaceae bacterium]
MKVKFKFMLALAVVLAAAGVQAQTRYTCRTQSGISYQSSASCPPGIVYYGPTATGQAYSAPLPSTGQAPSNLKYLSPRCASLNDAIRTAPARGLKYETIGEMRREYSRECAESESEAYSKLSDDRRAQQQQRSEARNAEKADRERASLREQQCGESKRILLSKRSRTDLTEGERAELRRFEENYRSRCA